MATLYLHIGTHKTASTAIQHALRDADRFAQSEGWQRVAVPAIGKEVMMAENYSMAMLSELHKQISASIKNAKSLPIDKFVLSFEGFSGSPAKGYTNSEIVSSILRDATKDYTVKIIVYLRRQDEWIESMYTQMIQQGESYGFDQFKSLIDDDRSLDYSSFLDNFESKFGYENMNVRSYHVASNSGIIYDFGRMIESSTLCNPVISDRKNPSYSEPALEIAKLVNPQLDVRQRKLLRKVLQDTLPKEQSASFSYFTDEERIKCLQKYSYSNHKVAVNYFDGDVNELFPAPTTYEVDSNNSGVSYHQAATLAVELLTRNTRPTQGGTRIRSVLSRFPRLKALLWHIIRGKR